MIHIVAGLLVAGWSLRTGYCWEYTLRDNGYTSRVWRRRYTLAACTSLVGGKETLVRAEYTHKIRE